VGLLEAEGFEKKEEVLMALNMHRKQLERAANEKTVKQKMEKEIKPEKGRSKKSTKGNTGSILLLSLLQQQP
jgi:hypothetical protein